MRRGQTSLVPQGWLQRAGIQGLGGSQLITAPLWGQRRPPAGTKAPGSPCRQHKSTGAGSSSPKPSTQAGDCQNQGRPEVSLEEIKLKSQSFQAPGGPSDHESVTEEHTEYLTEVAEERQPLQRPNSTAHSPPRQSQALSQAWCISQEVLCVDSIEALGDGVRKLQAQVPALAVQPLAGHLTSLSHSSLRA